MTQHNQPCPFCGSTDLSDNQWCLIADEETQAIECNCCFSGAPASSWNNRKPLTDRQYRVEWENHPGKGTKKGAGNIHKSLESATHRASELNKAWGFKNKYTVIPAEKSA